MSDTTKKSIPAKKLVKLGTKAPTFDMPVSIPTVTGGPIEISLNVKALRKTEWAKMRDDYNRRALETLSKPAEVQAETEDAARGSVQEALDTITKRGAEAAVRDGMQRDAEVIIAFANGWDLEDEFTEANLVALEDEYPGSLNAIVQRYDLATYQGRLGN